MVLPAAFDLGMMCEEMTNVEGSVGIPVISLDGFDSGEEARHRLSGELGTAFREIGFVGIRGHGISDEVRDRAYATTRQVFEMPADTKKRYEIAGSGGGRGYTAFGVEKAKDQDVADLKEFWLVGPEPIAYEGMLPNAWPEDVPEFRAAMLDLYAALQRAGEKVLTLVAMHLDLPVDFFADKVDAADTIMRPLHYPPLSGQVGVRAAAHEDINVVTLLVGSHEPGLEVLTRDGGWVPVTTLKDTIVCNVGDMLQRLTNKELVSTTHRVVNPPEPWSLRSRFSMPFFLHFNPQFSIETLQSCMDAERPNQFPVPITSQAYLEERLREIGLLDAD